MRHFFQFYFIIIIINYYQQKISDKRDSILINKLLIKEYYLVQNSNKI
ncbi:hypothetical protein pb186bvf_003981 [Paramecium bursaria]